MLAVELLRGLPPRLPCRPGERERDVTRGGPVVLDVEAHVHRVRVRAECQRFSDPQIPVFTVEGDLPLGALAIERQGLAGQPHRQDLAVHDEPHGPELADDDQRLLPAVLERKLLELAALARDDRTIERGVHGREALRRRGLLRRAGGCRARHRRGRSGRIGLWRRRLDRGLLSTLRLGRRREEEVLIDDEHRQHQAHREKHPLFLGHRVRASARAGDPTRRDGTDDNAGGGGARATRRARRRARGARDARTPSTWGRNGTRAAAGARGLAGRARRARRPRAPSGSRPGPRPGYRGERAPHLAEQVAERCREHRRPPDHDESRACRPRLASRTIRLAQPAARAIAFDGEADLATHGEADACRIGGLAPEDNERWTIDAPAPLEQRLEFSAGSQSLTSREAARQTVSRFRPFARRRLSTLRPPFVFMRSRKPCVFARRRRFGWNVRFIATPHSVPSPSRLQPSRRAC